jgi:aminoglycoside phosphotransferase (APT) family kinase protein
VSIDAEAARVVGWLNETVGNDINPASARLNRLPGGNSNLTYVLVDGDRRWLVRRPPKHGLDKSAHSMGREWTILRALDGTSVHPVGHCRDVAVLGAEFLVMDYLPDSVSITDTLPPGYGDDALPRIGFALIDALAAVHTVDWQSAGLSDFGRPDGFLERQVPRWEAQYRRNEVRELPVFDHVTKWLKDNQSPTTSPAIMHGDFHLDNCLFSRNDPMLLAVVDWEMATIGDPLMDLGLALALWGPRSVESPAMLRIQAVTRAHGAPTRTELIERYAEASGRDVSNVLWYQVLGLWKLAAIVEAAWGQHVRGELRTDYTAELGRDVPLLFTEAALLAGIA